MRGVVLGNTALLREGYQEVGSDGPINPESFFTVQTPEGHYEVQLPGKHAVRRYLLYWDKIAFPYTKSPDWYYPRSDWPDVPSRIPFPYKDLLISEKILSSVQIPHPLTRGLLENFMDRGSLLEEKSVIANSVRLALEVALQSNLWVASSAVDILNGRGGREFWSLGYSISGDKQGLKLMDPIGAITTAGAAQKTDQNLRELLAVNLLNALPVPGDEVPIEDILDLRVKRRPELLAFRAALDYLYQEIERSPDSRRAVATAVETVERSLSEIQKVFSEKWISARFESLRAYLSLDEPAAVKTLMGAAGAQMFHFSPVLGAAAGLAVNACLTFEKRRRTSQLDDLPPKSRDFAYLYYVQNLEKKG